MPVEEESLEEVRGWVPSGAHVFETTVKHFSGALTVAEYRACLDALATTPLLTDSGSTCVVFGYGSQSRATYDDVTSHEGVELLWTGPCLPLILSPLSHLMACQCGLLKISDATAVRPVLDQLSYMGMVEVLWCSSSLADEVVRYVRRKRRRAKPGTVVGKDPTYFLFGVERENQTYETGIVGWSSFGPECPSELRAILPIEVAGTGSPGSRLPHLDSAELDRIRTEVKRQLSRRNWLTLWTCVCVVLIIVLVALFYRNPPPFWVFLVAVFVPFVAGEILWDIWSSDRKIRCPKCGADWTRKAFLKWTECKGCRLPLSSECEST